MRISVFLGTALAALFLLFALALTAQAQAKSAFLGSGSLTLPPIGALEFCRRNPADCREQSVTVAPMRLSAERLHQLREVNDAVNRIPSATDREIYGRKEVWAYPNGRADCEDYALLKRKILIEAHGWHATQLLIAVVRDEWRDWHAVLVARTSEGDVVLDNKREYVGLWYNFPYQFVKMSSSRGLRVWSDIVETPVVTASTETLPPPPTRKPRPVPLPERNPITAAHWSVRVIAHR